MARGAAPGAAGLTLRELAEQAYPDPDEFATIDQLTRSRHADIHDLDDETLRRERGRAWMRWMTTDRPSDGLCERVQRLDAETRRRQRDRR